MKSRLTPPAYQRQLALFSRTAEAVSDNVIRSYSSSFGLSTRLLGKRHRRHIRNIYALVRVADEIVDGVARQAGLSLEEQVAALQRYANETHNALRTGYSSDLVIHAFAGTARKAGIDASLTGPFFESMRTDLDHANNGFTVFDRREHASYVYGSAEVIGLMCLRVFLRDRKETATNLRRLEEGARQLGAAFQNINFLRDLGNDTEKLGRGYLGTCGPLTQSDLQSWIAEIRGQLLVANQAIPLLPHDARTAVRSAHALFKNLTDRLAQTPAGELHKTRIRVPDTVKAALASLALLTTISEWRR